MKVNCGFRKWSIGYNEEERSVEVKFHDHPNYGTINLHDATYEELIALGHMFLALGNQKVTKEV